MYTIQVVFSKTIYCKTKHIYYKSARVKNNFHIKYQIVYYSQSNQLNRYDHENDIALLRKHGLTRNTSASRFFGDLQFAKLR